MHKKIFISNGRVLSLIFSILIITCVFSVNNICAQTKTKSNQFSYDSTSVVYDSSGLTTIPYLKWSRMMPDPNYIMTTKQNETGEIISILKRLTPQERRYIEKNNKPSESPYFHKGENFSFEFTDIYKNVLTSDSLKGNIIVFSFWIADTIRTPPQIAELNEMVSLFSNNKNVIFISILEIQEEDLEGLLRSYPIKSHIVPGGWKFMQKYNIFSSPLNFIVDKNGNIYFHTSGYGPATAYWIKDAINNLLKAN